MKQNPFFGGLLGLCLLMGFSACPGSFLDDPLQTPANFTVTAYSHRSALSWDPVPGVAGYRIRLNGKGGQTVTASSWSYFHSVALGEAYTVSALYSDGREGHPAGPVVVRDIASVSPADAVTDHSPFIVSGSGAAQPAAWYDAAITLGQTAHYYIIPIDKTKVRYRIWWNDSDQGSGKTLDVRVIARWYETNDVIGTYDSGYSPAGITVDTNSPNNTGYLVIWVEPWTAGNSGTYGIAYNYDE
jgi:hypothetical protein